MVLPASLIPHSFHSFPSLNHPHNKSILNRKNNTAGIKMVGFHLNSNQYYIVSIDFQTINSCMEKGCYGMAIIYSHFPAVLRYKTIQAHLFNCFCAGSQKLSRFKTGFSCCSSQNLDNFQLWSNGKGACA